MKRVAELLADLDLPEVAGADAPPVAGLEFLPELGADLPAGHLHLWGGPRGVGKTTFLLALLGGAATRGRRVLYATYHLPASTLALRWLAMASGVDAEALARGALRPEQAHAAAAARSALTSLDLGILEARGLSLASLEDRLVRLPYRADVLGVDYLQAVIRPEGQDLGGLVRDLTALASHHHLAVVGALEANEEPHEVGQLAHRTGWIAPAGTPHARRAEVIENRYGPREAVKLWLDEAAGVLRRVTPA